MAILQAIDTVETPEQELARLRAENAALKAQQQAKIKLKVSDRGCVQILGIGSKFGVTLYPRTMLTILDMAEQIRAFIKVNHNQLSWTKASE